MQKERESEAARATLGGLVRKIRANRKLELLLYAGVAVLVLLLYVSGTREKEKGGVSVASVGTAAAQSGQDTEEKLKAVLSCIRGAGKVEVMITYETGREIVTAMTTNTNTSSSISQNGSDTSQSSQTTETSQPATYSGEAGKEPIVLYEKEPTIRGVIVVAEGAADVTVRLDLQRAVRAVLDVPLSAIEVFERSAGGEQ